MQVLKFIILIDFFILGHWVHADNPEQTLKFIAEFFDKIDKK